MPKIDVTKTELVWPGKYSEDGTLKGVGVASTATSPPPPIVIEPVQERLEYDIAIPITKPSLKHDHRKLSEFDKQAFRLSATKPFGWRRNLPPLEAKKTVFNFVATYNDFERRFAEFLDNAGDVLRFAAMGTTEQGASGTSFRVDYLKPSGAIGFYSPDWVAVQRDTEGEEVNWIIETKGREWEGAREKDEAMQEWCRRVSGATGNPWHCIRVNQTEFRSDCPTLRYLVVEIIGNAMLEERDRRGTVMTSEEVRHARNKGRA